MNTITMQLSRNRLIYFRLLYNVQKTTQKSISTPYYATTLDAIDVTLDYLHRQRNKKNNNLLDVKKLAVRYFMDTETPKDISDMTTEELDNFLLRLMSKNKDKQLEEFIKECTEQKKMISDIMLKKMLRNYSIDGKVDVVENLQKYSMKVCPITHKRNGEFLHYLAKAQCMKGNSEKGLSILSSCYKRYVGLRSFYRIILRELIQDTVLNRSEASLVIFKKYVLEFSETWGDHYPLVCYWHICWSSSWYSDQMLSNDLLELSPVLQDIVRDKATAFSITILRQEYNEDAVVRLLQALLKYGMMTEYVKVLQVLFSYKLKNRDLRGCTEIIQNCKVLGVSLSADHHGRYIKMLIDGKEPEAKLPSKNFKLKF